MIAAPLPLLWRQQEMIAALLRCAAKAIVTCARIGASAPADIAMQAAAEVFAIRHVCGFGPHLPDGVTPLDDIFAGEAAFQPSPRSGNAAAHLAAITFDVTADGLAAAPRNHSQLITGGLAVFLESGIAADATIMSTIPCGSFAALAVALVPWLLAGGTLVLHHASDAAVFTEQCRTHDTATVVLPGSVLSPLAEPGLLGGRTMLALWRTPEHLAAAPAHANGRVIDVASFGEIALLPARRGVDGMPAPIPCGPITAQHASAGGLLIAESVPTKAGRLALRGLMLLPQAYRTDDDGFIDTAVPCRLNADSNTLAIVGPHAGITNAGGYRLRQRDIEEIVAGADKPRDHCRGSRCAARSAPGRQRARAGRCGHGTAGKWR